jgi:acetyl/propionyl-CoA carboxylase alpha subunit
LRAQISITAGEPLPWAQDQLTQRGHAIEARVYAEDPARDDLPQAGPLLLYREPVMPGVRVDAGVVEGGEVTVHYDPMLAKLIATGETREAARVRALEALRRFPILGVRTNIAFLIEILQAPWFVSGEIDTRLLDRESDALRARLRQEPPPEVAAIANALTAGPKGHAPQDPWISLRGLRV